MHPIIIEELAKARLADLHREGRLRGRRAEGPRRPPEQEGTSPRVRGAVIRWLAARGLGTADPAAATIRPLRAGETRVIEEVFSQLSPESVQLRFHVATRLTPANASRLAAVVPGIHEAYVAELAGRPVGIARWHRYSRDPGTADLAVEVADRVQRRGIGSLLVAAAIRSARRAGVRELLASVHPDNTLAHLWLSAAGALPPARYGDDFRLPIGPFSGTGMGEEVAAGS